MHSWCRKQNDAHAVVDANYVQILDFSSATLADCRRADRRNDTIHKGRLKLIMHCGGSVAPSSELDPPMLSNEARYKFWQRANMCVRADLQTAGVEKLMDAEYDLDDISPEDVIEKTCAHELVLPCSFYQPYGGNTQGYAIYTLSELEGKTLKQCSAADSTNAQRFSRLSRRSISARSQLSTATWAQVLSAPHPPPSNSHRKSQLLERQAMVSACRQTTAVQQLYRAGMRAGMDYEPQNAITEASLLQCVGPMSPSQSPPPLYPVLSLNDPPNGDPCARGDLG
jgi:hypothetical protein